MEKDLILVILAAAVLLFVVWLLIPRWMIKRNVSKVVRIFQTEGAIGVQNAKTIEELGLRPKSMLQGMFSRRDWKPSALYFLIQTDVVLQTEDGKFYITEESLASATWLKLKE